MRENLQSKCTCICKTNSKQGRTQIKELALLVIFCSHLLKLVFFEVEYHRHLCDSHFLNEYQGILQELISFFKFKCENDNSSGDYIVSISTVTTETSKVSMQRYLYLAKEIIEL